MFAELAEAQENGNYTGRYGDMRAHLARSDARAPATLLAVPRLVLWAGFAGHVFSPLFAMISHDFTRRSQRSIAL
jgi:hypothetical protein